MRRALLSCMLILLGLPAGALAARVKLLACVPAPAAQDRSATFEARVRRVHASERMQVHFTLQVRDAALPGWRRVVAAGLDEWQTSDPGVRRYLYAKTVQNLAAPASYRTVVRFRWLDEAGAVLKRSRATSRSCRQPDLRPDLTVTGIELEPPLAGAPASYRVALRNRGRTAADPFSTALTAGDLALESLTLPGLAAGESRVLVFGGPACTPGEALTATIDPGRAVDERNEDNNVLAALCPPA